MEDLKTPPHSIQAEQAILGGLMLDDEGWSRIEWLLAPEDFYRYDHNLIYAAAAKLAGERNPVDLTTVADKLGDRLEEVGGQAYLATLVNNTPTTANLEHYAQVVADHANKRRVIATLGEQQTAAFQAENAADVIDTTTNLLSRIESSKDPGYIDRKTGLREFHADLQKTFENRQKGILPGIPTGNESFDRKFGGLHGGDLIVVAGRPSMGKSALAHTWQINQAKQGYVTAIHSLEMPDRQLNQRWMAMLSGVSVEKIKNADLGEAEWDRLVNAQGRLVDLPIYSHDKPATASQITRQARRMKKDIGLDVLYVDYLQVVQAEFGNTREEQVSAISRAFKSLALELDIPVVLVAQLNRGLEQRADKRPLMADLRESGQIEQDADVIIFIYRDALYNEGSDPTDAEILVRKYRQGEPGQTRLRFIGERTMFADAEWRYE